MNKEFVVLVVEDDSMTRNVIIETLRFDGFKTEEADGFRSSLELFSPGKYKVVVMDNQLGDGIGVELCRQLIARDKAIKIFLFAGASEDARLEALNAGATRVLQKPYDLAKLSFLIRSEANRNMGEADHSTAKTFTIEDQEFSNSAQPSV